MQLIVGSDGVKVECIYNKMAVTNITRRVRFYCIQLFRQRLSHKSVKAYATMPIGMGTKSLALTD